MKHILNNLSNEEKNSIREQHTGGMNVVTENFHRLLSSKLGDVKPLVNEQSDSRMPFQPETFGYNPNKPQTTKVATQKQSEFFKSIDPHTLATVLSIGSVFIPVVGPFLAAGIGLADAALHYKKGDTKTAALVAAFSLLPGVASVVSKIPGVKQLGAKGMAALASRLSKGARITDATEIAIVNGINLNKNLVQNGLNSHTRTVAQQAIARTTNPTIKQQLGKLAKATAEELTTDQAVGLIRARV
jgi:hypothetical protein